MRYLHIVIGITFFITLSVSLTGAGDVYLWTDDEGVTHITDNPRSLPHGGDIERIRYRHRGDVNRQPLSDKKRALKSSGMGTEEQEAVNGRDKGLSEDPYRRERERKLERAREEYERARELVEKRRRRYSRKSTRPNRDRYRHALDELAEKRDQLRELKRQK
ncbi:MAG: DUF4124 domain-containing protein [Deltaproteobacteria bacterium]|nr:DUF4124 domain-containing protein [Deltaproteobacteria bacterium]